MLINQKIIDNLKENEILGQTENIQNRIDELLKNRKTSISKVKYQDENNFSIEAVVGKDKLKPYIRVENGEIEDVGCDCGFYKKNLCGCVHVIAMCIHFNNSPIYNEVYGKQNKNFENKEIQISKESHHNIEEQNDTKYRIYRQLVNSFLEEEEKEESKKVENHENKIRLVPIFKFDANGNILVQFKIGTEKKYKIKNLSEFYERMEKNELYSYGKNLEFVHEKEAFDKKDVPLLNFVLKNAEIIKSANENTKYHYYGNIFEVESIILENSVLDEFFEIMKGKTKGEKEKISFQDKEPDINFALIDGEEKDEYDLVLESLISNYEIIEGKDYIYFLETKNPESMILYRCKEDFIKTTYKILNEFIENRTDFIPLKKNEFSSFYSLIYPKIKNHISLENVDQEELKKYLPKKLIVKIYLDYNRKNKVIANIKFCYDNVEINPFEENEKVSARDNLKESRVLELFKKLGFLYNVKEKNLILTNDEKIFEFLKSGVNILTDEFEVFATDKFKDKKVIVPKISSAGIKVNNNLLEIDLSNININKKDIEEVMNNYKIKKRFYKLQNGKYIDLEQNEDLKVLQDISELTELSYEKMISGKFELQIYRGMYLDKILEKGNIKLNKDKEYDKLITSVYNEDEDDDFKVPKGLKANLRDYQKKGFEWLKTLDNYKLGGILADDMGLGKTIQVIALILSYKEENKKKMEPSIVICPSSLCLNWQEESKRFAPDLKTLVISGTMEQRHEKIKNIDNYDLVITSYDLLKRDQEIYEEKNYKFRFLIADEAQYIKNNNTQNSKAIKKINADSKFALTGTPIENSLSELWSIFDLIMPGYLYSYNKFKTNYETPIVKEDDKEALDKLKVLIEPFILRRLKEKVLAELPEKNISVLNNEMEGEQLKIYLSYLEKSKKQAEKEINENGIEKSQIKILSLLMRLRQICCHPGLFIDNYTGESSKLTQCIEIVKNAVSGGHKILIFSGYSSMFPYIENELEKENIQYLKLTGKTKVSDRLELVNKFNSDNNIKVFLISLKAGGTGLNLIGADMVIHYDPWWNLSAENQATDRTYRIGQKKNVQVYKLITKNSIEEKIYNLQEKKAKLAENTLSTKETFINSLSKDEIMKLFEE